MTWKDNAFEGLPYRFAMYFIPQSAWLYTLSFFWQSYPIQVWFKNWNNPNAVLVGFWAVWFHDDSLYIRVSRAAHSAPESHPYDEAIPFTAFLLYCLVLRGSVVATRVFVGSVVTTGSFSFIGVTSVTVLPTPIINLTLRSDLLLLHSQLLVQTRW